MTSAGSSATVPLPGRGLLALTACIRVMASEVEGKRLASGSVFIGREWELAQLHVALCEAQAGRGQLFVVSGEAGIGKTRLVGKLADRADNENVRVLVGAMLGRRGDSGVLAVDPDLPDYDVQLGSERSSKENGSGSF